MGRSKALVLAASVAICAIGATNARAADLLPPPPMVDAPPPPADFGGWYLRGDIGVGVTEVSGWRNTLLPQNMQGTAPPWVLPVFASVGDSTIFGAGIGYQVNNWFRADVTGEYRSGGQYRAAVGWADQFGGFGADVYSGSLHSGVFLANGYLDLGNWRGIIPFVSGGVGLASHWMNGFIDHTFGYAQDTTKTNFAWQVGGGVGYAITPNARLELSYRYLDMGKFSTNPISCIAAAQCWQERHHFNLASHDIRLGFRYILAAAPAPALMPMPAPGPLIRKY